MPKVKTEKEKKEHLEQWLKSNGHKPEKVKGNTTLEVIANTFDLDINFLQRIKEGKKG
jgi:hypothetical protein